MVSGELLSINLDTGLAFFLCWNSSARPVLAQLNLKSLDKFPNLKPEYLQPGVRVSCSFSRKKFGADEIFEISSLELVDVPISAFKGIPISKASIVHKSKSNKSAHVLCHIPALSVLSESKVGEWFYAPEEVTVLAEFYGDRNVLVEDLEVGEVVQVNLEWTPGGGKATSLLYDAHNAWKVTRLTRTSVVTSQTTENIVDTISTKNRENVDYFGLNVISCIARTDHHMYLVVEVVEWNSPEAKLKACLPKKIPVRGRKNGEEDLEVGMCLISFFSRSVGEGWVHHFSENFDSYYWICGKSVDGFRYMDLKGVARDESAELRRFEQTRCSKCCERISSPQLVSAFNFSQTRLELDCESNQTLVNLEPKTEEDSAKDVEPSNNLTPTYEAVTQTDVEDLARIVENGLPTPIEKERFTSTPILDTPTDKNMFQKLEDMISNGEVSNQSFAPKLDKFREANNDEEKSTEESDAAATTSSNSSSTLENDSLIISSSSNNNNKATEDGENVESNSNREETGSSSYETVTMTETEDSDNKESEAKMSRNDRSNVLKMWNGSTGGTKRTWVMPEASPNDSILSLEKKSFQNDYEYCSPLFVLPPRFRDRDSRPKRSRYHRSYDSTSSGSLNHGPELMYKVPAKVVCIEPSIKLEFRHLSSSSNVCVEVVGERVKVENKFGAFICAQEVALTWLRRHLHVDQVVEINAIVDKEVWKVLLIRGEFKAQSKPSSHTEKSVINGSSIHQMPLQQQSVYNQVPPPINAAPISQHRQQVPLSLNQLPPGFPKHPPQQPYIPGEQAMSIASITEVGRGAESVSSSSKLSTIQNQRSADSSRSFNFRDAAKTAKEFVPKSLQVLDKTSSSISQRSSMKSIGSTSASRYDPSRPLFKKVRLTSTGDVIHIANIGDKPWVVSAEISALIPRWNGDILAKMLKLVGEARLTLVYKRDESFSLFEQCINEDLPGVFVGEEIVDSLTFYRLLDVPDILQKFNTTLKDELLNAVIGEIERFDPNDLHWSGDQQI